MSTERSGGKKCSYLNCTNTTTNSVLSFFTFPIKDKERCCTWIVNCGRDDLVELTDKKLQYRTVCASHFKECAFVNANKKKLIAHHPDAVPIPYFQAQLPVCESIDKCSDSLEENVLDKGTANLKVIMLDKGTTTETVEQFYADFKPLPETPEIEGCKNKLNLTPTPRKKKLLKSLSIHRLHLKRSRSKVEFLTARTKKHTQKDLLQSLPNYLTGEVLTFVQMQIKHQNHTPWNEEERNIALSIYYKSPSVYRFLRGKGFKLPCLTLIKKWINVCNLSPGFSQEVIDKLSIKASTMSEEERQCVLLMDEMSIKKGLEYNQKFDLIEGFEDLGPLGRSKQIGSHALFFLLRGLKYQWKCPFAYVISSNSVLSSSLALLLDMCIDNVLKTGLKVRAIVCDQGSTNAAAALLMGVSERKPFVFYGDTKIYFLFDVPNLFKSIRNNMINHDIVVDGKNVSWNDVRTFYDLDKNSKTDCRLAPKLSDRHINPTNFLKMNVRLATQVMSASVAQGMKAACRLGVMKSPTALDTAMFLGKLNDLFDCLNSRSCYDANPLRRPLSESNPKVLQCLRDSLIYVETLKLNAKKRNPPCFGGLAMTIRGVLLLYDDLQMEKATYLLTSRLNQDPIENLFGVLRQRGGYNPNPSAAQFRRNLQHAMSIRLMNPPLSSNCEPDSDVNISISISPRSDLLCQTDVTSAYECEYGDDRTKKPHEQEHLPQDEDLGTSLAPALSALLSIFEGCDEVTNMQQPLSKSADQPEDYEIDHPENDILKTCYEERFSGGTNVQTEFSDSTTVCNPALSSPLLFSDGNRNETSPLEDNAISYIAGWLAKKTLDKFKCEMCTSVLVNISVNIEPPKEGVFTQLKAFTCHNGELAKLHHPSDLQLKVVKSQMIMFTQLYEECAHERALKKSFETRIKLETEKLYKEWFTQECQEHRAFMLSLLVKCKLFYKVKWLSNDLKDKALINLAKRKNSQGSCKEKSNKKLRKVQHL